MALKTQQEDAPTINLTSMIDVLFLLIIFFMVGTRFNDSEKSIDLNLPKVSNASAMIAGPENRVVSITQAGRLALDGRTVTRSELTQQLRDLVSRYADTAVDVRCDGGSTAQQFAEVFTAVQNAGVKRIGFRTNDSGNTLTR